jgi:hypothetical protein
MTFNTFHLPDGSTLTQARQDNGQPRGIDSVTSRTLTYVGDDDGGLLVDANGAAVREVRKKPLAVRPAETKPTSKSKDRSRWVTFNTFVDRVARHLDDAEQGAWYVLFRWTQDDTAEIRLDDIAARIGKSTRTVSRAVDRLVEVGLLERLKRGTRQGGPSRYRLQPDPSVCLPRLQADAQPQRDTGDRLKATPKHQKRDRRGAFTT